MTDDLAFDLIGSDGISLGAAFLGQEGQSSPIFERIEHLVIALSGEAMLLCGRGSTESFTFTFQEHDQAGRDFVVRGDHKFASGSDDAAIRSSNFMILASS